MGQLDTQTFEDVSGPLGIGTRRRLRKVNLGDGVEVDGDTADIMSANAIMSQVRAFDGDADLPTVRGVDPDVLRANRILTLAKAEHTLQDPAADHERYFEAARLVAQERGREAIQANEARAVRAQASTDPADLATRTLELFAQHNGDPERVTRQIVREGWDRRLITPELLGWIDTNLAESGQVDPASGQPIENPNRPMLEVLKRHLLAMRDGGILPEGEDAGTPVAGQMPLRISVSGFGPAVGANMLADAQNRADPQGERGFMAEQVAAAGRAVGSTWDALGAWLPIAGQKLRDPLRTLDQIASMASPVYAAMAPKEARAALQSKGLNRMIAAGGRLNQAADALNTAGGLVETAGTLASMATRPSPSVATGDWRDENGDIAWKTIAANLTETTTQLGIQVAGGAAATVATGNPVVGVAVGAALGSGMDTGSVMRETFTKQVQSGEDIEDARATAATVGMVYAPIAAMMEYIPMEEYLGKSPVGKEAKKQLVGAVAKRVGRVLAAPTKEGLTEIGQEAWQDFSQWAMANDKEAFEDWQSRYAKAGTLGFIAGGGAKVTTAVYNRVMDTTPARGEPVEPSKPLTQMTPEELAAAKAARAPRVQQDLPKVIGAIAKQNGLTADQVGITADADLTAEQKRVADLGNELGVDVVYIDGGKELDTASAAASRAGLVVIDRNASGTNAAESLLQHEVVHELRARLKAAGREGEWSRIVDAVRGADTEGFETGKAQYGKSAEAAGLNLDEDTKTEEGVAVAGEEAVAGFLRATVDDGDILAFVNRTPNTAERITDAIQRTLRKLGLFNRRTLLENLRGKVSEARVYRELRSAMSILRETARTVPLTSDPVGTRTIPIAEDSAVEAGVPLAGREIGEVIPLEGERRTEQPDPATLTALRASKPRPLSKRAIEELLLSRWEPLSETEWDAKADAGEVGTGSYMFTFYKKIPSELTEELKAYPQLLRKVRVSDDLSKTGGDDAMSDMGSDAYIKMLLRDSSGQVKQAKEWAKKNRGGDPEAAFFAALLDRLPKGKMKADTMAPSEFEVGDEFTVAGVPVRVELRGSGEFAYRVLVDHGDLPVTPLDAMDGGVPVDRGTLQKGEYGVEGEQGAPMPEDAMREPGDDIPFALRRMNANQAADIAGQQGLYGQGTTKTGEKQGGLFGAVAEEPKPAQYPLSPEEQRDGESDADYRIRMKFREAEKNTGALFALKKNLVVMHNLTANNIRFADELGGVLAMPSVAIANADSPLTNFGDISLIARKDLVDPRASRTNRVYDADVYSPRYPGASYKFKTQPPIWKAIESWVTKTYGDLRSDTIKKESYDIRSVLYGFSGHLDAGEFPNRGIDELYRDGALQAYYAANKLGKTFRDTDRGDGREQLSEAIKAEREPFEQWVRDNFAPHIERKLFQGFTNAGNRRYADYTIDNVMKMMRKQQREEGGESSFYGAGSIRAKVAKRYKSIAEIQRDRGRIVPSIEDTKSEYNDRLQQVAELGRGAFESVSDRDFGFTERFWSAVFDAKQRGRAYVEKNYGLNYDALPWTEINTFLSDLRSLPTEYFEAKLDRTVGLGEFSGAVVPSDVPADVLGILEKHGINDIEKYARNDDASRASAVNALAERQDALFALRNPSGRRFRDEGAQLRGAVGAALREPAGMQTIGRPDLANPGRTEAERRVVNAADQLRERPAPQKVQEWVAAADDRLKADYAGEKQALIDKINRGELLDSTETVLGQTFVADAALNILSTGDEKAFVEAMRIHNAYRQSGTDWARAGVARRDRVETPAERHARFIGQILAEPDPQTRKQLDKATERFRTSTNPAVRGGAKLDIDRLLERQAQKAQKIRDALLAAGINPAQINDQTIADPDVAAHIARVVSSAKSPVVDKVSEYWINSILSGPQTQVANIVGNAAYGGWETLIQRGIEGASADVARAFGMDVNAGAKSAPTLREYRAVARAMGPALARAGRNFLLAWSRETPILEAEVAAAGGETGSGSKLELPDVRAKIGGTTGRVVRAFGTRQLLAFDEFFKGLWGTMDVHGRAYRMALSEGLRGEAAWNRVAELTGDLGSDAWAESLRFAENVAFQSENELANKVVNARQWVNDTLRVPVGTFTIPFVKTPLNILKGAAEKTPLATAQAGLHLIRGDYKGNPALLARDVANNMVGWSLAALLTAAVGDDDEDAWITGSTSPDRGERETQYRIAPPMSVRVGDKWVSYARIEPLATILGTLVDTIRRGKRSGSATEAIASVAESLKNQVQDKTFLQGLADVFSLMDKDANAGQQAAQWAKNFAVSWVPNIIRQPARATDPMLRETRIRKTDEGGVWDSALQRAMQSVLPIAANAPPPKVDLWGREIAARSLSSPATDIPYRMFSPMQLRSAEDNPLDRMIVKYNASVPDEQRWFPVMPPPTISRTINGEKRTYRMTDDEYNTFLRVAGQNSARRLMGMRLNIDNPTDRDMQTLKREIEDARSDAREYILRRRSEAR